MKLVMNTYNLQLFLTKLRQHKTANFEVNHHSILLLESKNESPELSDLQTVFKMSGSCTDTLSADVATNQSLAMSITCCSKMVTRRF